MTQDKEKELFRLARRYFSVAASHVDNKNPNLNESLRKALTNLVPLNEEAEVPGFEDKPVKFGSFVNREFVVLMTDIRKSTEIINEPGGLVNMFLIFYVYAGVVSNIVDSYNGTSTEFLGDGVINLFDTKEVGRDEALKKSILAAWDIMDARERILNPLFAEMGLKQINYGIGIDHGITIVTKFGYKNDTDLKAFGRCVYNASKLSKGINEIYVSDESKKVWPTGPGGNLRFGFGSSLDDGTTLGFKAFKNGE